MQAKPFLCLILLCGFATIAASEVHYIIRPSQSQSCPGDRYSSAAACVDNVLTLSQFVNNSNDYLTNDTTLIFSPGNYSLELELVVENVHSFSMSAWPTPSLKAVITCGHNAMFEFRNVSTVSVSGLEFVGCFENHVLSVGHFQLENSGFFGNGEAIVNGTVLSIEESTASLDRVAFVSVLDEPLTTQQVLELLYQYNCTELAVDRAIGISVTRSNISITQSSFEGNNVGIIGGVIYYDESGSDITIVNTTFINNSASVLFTVYYKCGCYNDCSKDITSYNGIVYANGHGNIVEIYDSKFIHNVGVVLFGQNDNNVLITHTKFINNEYQGYYYYKFAVIYVTHTNLNIRHSTFISNTGKILAAWNTSVSISHSDFFFNYYSYYGGLYTFDGVITIDHSKFINNTGSWILGASNVSVVSVTHSEFIDNNVRGTMLYLDGVMITVSLNEFIDNTVTDSMLYLDGVMITVSLSEFVNNTVGGAVVDSSAENTITEIISIDHSKFINNTGSRILYTSNVNMISVTHSEFADNTVRGSILYLDGVMLTVSLSEFINNTAGYVVYMRYYTSAENLTNNLFFDNSAAYEISINPACRSDLSLSLGSSRCIPCSENWHRDLIGIVIAALIAGIALVIFMLALNMTVAIGTLNGILFYANIVAANTETYFLPFTAPNFVTVFISWLNLDIGFDVCLFGPGISTGSLFLFKPLLQIAFPAYVIFLVIVVIVTSNYSSKFAKIIGKGNPVAVLATLVLLSYTKFLNTIFASLYLLFLDVSAYGSQNLDVSRSEVVQLSKYYEIHNQTIVQSSKGTRDLAIGYSLATIFLLLCIIFTTLVFSWQWLLRHQDKVIFKWVRYQKLHLFLEPYHAPYTANYRYWTGLLLLVRVLIYIISALNFSLDPRVDLMAVIFIVGGLILLKGVTAKRVYKNWPLDVMETAIYFNLVAFSALTWYNLDFGGNQVAVAYTSVVIIFILLLGVIVFHVLRYTRLYKKAFKWTSSKLLEKKPKEDGYRLERSAPGDQELPTVTYSVIEINQPAQNQEENNEEK